MYLDLHRHAVLEASAGTGKTHSIGELVLRLLKEEGVSLDRILIVTFTDKATGELKARLRNALELELAASPEHWQAIRAAIDGFDQAWIFTLHGFCRRVLLEFHPEQGQDVQSRLVHDGELIEPCLRELQRRTWRQEYGPLLKDVLHISGYDRQQARRWEGEVRELVLKMRAECGQRLLPAVIADWPRVLQNLDSSLRAALPRLRELLHEVLDAGPFPGPTHIKTWLEDPSTQVQPLATFHDLVVELSKKSSGFFLGSGKVPDAFAEMLKILEQLRSAADWTTFRWQLAVRTIAQLQTSLESHKRQHGLWSFQDMLARVDDALDPLKNPRANQLASLLRRRFRYGIVDEFQDTDPVQWRILQRIFLPGGAEPREGPEDGSPWLFLVGDPKQAIFGFRGADLPTYQEAAQEMLGPRQAQDYPLLVNWRSSPDMIASLNRLFGDGAWFPPDSHIRYLPVQAAPEDERPSKLVADRTGRPALNVIDWRKDQLLVKLRRRHAEFIVDEIRRLLTGGDEGPSLVSINKATPRPLHAGDICVLVFRRREARPLLAGLRQAGIPYSFYKQAALWKSEEAVHLRFVLESLSQPEHRPAFRKALMTRFFRISPQSLAENDDLPTRHPARLLFDCWLDLAGRRQWSALFQSMLEDTGLFFSDDVDGDADRSRANYRHLTNELMRQAYRQNLDLLALTEWFRRQESLGVADEDVQPKETERPRLQIMTIHASKGLEYPVVFLAGGWTKRQADTLLCYRNGQSLVYDLTSPPLGSAAHNAAERDKLDEQRRLLYVALTRAMFKLYIPQTLIEGRSWKAKGPIIQLLAPALERAGLDQLPSTQAAIIDPGSRTKPKRDKSAPDSPLISAPSLWHIEGPLIPVLDADLSRRGIVTRSFTSMHRAAQTRTADGSSFAADPPRVEDEDDHQAEPEAPSDPLRGAVFGEIVHGVLEKIDFDAVGQTGAPELLLTPGSPIEKVLAAEIDHYLPQLPVRMPPDELRFLCRQRVAELVWHALHALLPELGCPLWRVPAQDRLQELSFHFAEESSPRSESFVTGFIDLLVRRQGRYFLIDWKTNVLPDYGPDAIERAMKEGDYHLQYRLYLQALERWLKRCLGQKFDWQRDLGGVYYLFLRGLTADRPGEGVFFHRPTA